MSGIRELSRTASGGIGDSVDVSIVLPCLNEAGSIEACVKEAFTGLLRAGLSGEVIVVDNGSTDDSARLAASSGARVVEESTPGYGSALRSGFKAAKGDIVVMADADLTYDLTRLGEIVLPIINGEADLIMGARLEGANRDTMPLLHRFVGTPAISFLLRRVCGNLKVRDSQSGYRAFRSAAVRDLDLKATGMEFASEMLIRASQEGLRIAETSIGYRPRVGDSKLSTFVDGWRHLQLILLLAPQLLLFWPGLALLTIGIGLNVTSLIKPGGVAIGTMRWQPIFFAPILMILGILATVAGAVLAYHSSLSTPRTVRSFSFVGDERFSIRVFLVGLLSTASGLVIDVALFFIWASGSDPPASGMALAGLAQALIVAGIALAIFGTVHRMLERRNGYLTLTGDVDVLALSSRASDHPTLN